jgi:hypothetical protein
MPPNTVVCLDDTLKCITAIPSLVPTQVLATRLHKLGNRAVPQGLIWWESMPKEWSSWENLHLLASKFPALSAQVWKSQDYWCFSCVCGSSEDSSVWHRGRMSSLGEGGVTTCIGGCWAWGRVSVWAAYVYGPCVWAIVPAHVNNYDYCSLWWSEVSRKTLNDIPILTSPSSSLESPPQAMHYPTEARWCAACVV